MTEHDCPRRRGFGDDALQPADPVARQRTELDPDLGRRGGDRVVVLGAEAHHACRLGGAKAERKRCPECDRHLAEELALGAAADDTLHPVDERDGLQTPLEHGEQRALVALMDGEFPWQQPDVGRDPGEPLALDQAELREDRDLGDLLGRQHSGTRSRVMERSYGPIRVRSRDDGLPGRRTADPRRRGGRCSLARDRPRYRAAARARVAHRGAGSPARRARRSVGTGTCGHVLRRPPARLGVYVERARVAAGVRRRHHVQSRLLPDRYDQPRRGACVLPVHHRRGPAARSPRCADRRRDRKRGPESA